MAIGMSRASRKSRSPHPARPSPACCSFCGKTQDEVKRIIAGPSVYICDLCVGVCATIIGREEGKAAAQLGVFTKSTNEVEKCLALLRELRNAGLIDEAEHKAKARKLLTEEPQPVAPPPEETEREGQTRTTPPQRQKRRPQAA